MSQPDRSSSAPDATPGSPSTNISVRPRRLSSMRTRLTGWYALLLAVVLGVFSIVLYLTLEAFLDGQVDDNLRQSVDQALGGLRLTSGRLSLPPNEGESDIDPLVERGLLVRVIDLDGKPVQSAGPFRTLQLPPELIASAMQGHSSFSNVTAPGDGTPARLYAAPYIVDGKVYGAVVVGQSLQPNQAALSELLLVLSLAVPLTLVFASAGGLFLASRALQPIDRITRTAQRISASNLGQRLNLPLPDDEVGRLARTFDSMLARLDDAFRRQRQFTADASHEMRTPLAIIKGNIGVTLNRPRKAGEYETVLKDVEEEVDRLTRLVEDLLLLARADGDLPLLHTEELDLADVLGVVLEQVTPLARARGQNLGLNIPSTIPIQGDPDKLLRLFLNLLDNATKYTPEAGKIEVRSRAGIANWVVIDVADSGPGIAPEQAELIFERFYRVDEARGRKSGGVGLGLALARWIAEAHGGRIEVSSKPGHGSIFSVWLPRHGGE